MSIFPGLRIILLAKRTFGLKVQRNKVGKKLTLFLLFFVTGAIQVLNFSFSTTFIDDGGIEPKLLQYLPLYFLYQINKYCRAFKSSFLVFTKLSIFRNFTVFCNNSSDLSVWNMWKYALPDGIKKRRAESFSLHLFDR